MAMIVERQEKIRRLLAQHGRLSTEALARRFQVAAMTIRRDFATLENTGHLTRTHGGCVPQGRFTQERPFSEKVGHQTKQKIAIAGEVVRHITPGCSVYLDTGTTAVQMARAIPQDLELNIFTNNLSVAMELFGRKNINVIVYGGTLAGKSPDLVGEIAIARVDEFRLDLAIIGADAVNAGEGAFYSTDTATAVLSRTVQKHAARTFVMADSSKFGRSGLTLAGRLTGKATVFTDNGISASDRAAMRKTGAKVICV